MKFEIKNRFSGKVQIVIEGKTFKSALIIAIKQGANLQDANLRWADLRNADLQDANLRWADLRNADLQDANLRNANLQEADLRNANLQEADLQDANLQDANLQEADLRWADLQGANLDFSCWPLSCKSFKVKADDRLVSQLFAHWARLDVSQCSPMVKYAHKTACALFGRYLQNLFCKFRNDVDKI